MALYLYSVKICGALTFFTLHCATIFDAQTSLIDRTSQYMALYLYGAIMCDTLKHNNLDSTTMCCALKLFNLCKATMCGTV